MNKGDFVKLKINNERVQIIDEGPTGYGIVYTIRRKDLSKIQVRSFEVEKLNQKEK